MPYIGNQSGTGFSKIPAKQDLTGATGTSLTLTHAVASAEGIDLFINNVRQEPTTAYSVGTDGVTVTLTGSVAATDDIYVVYNSLAQQTGTHPSNQALQATSGAFSGALSATTGTFTGDVTTTGDFKPTGKEYFQVFLTTQQNGQTDNTANVIEFGSKGTVTHDTKSNVDTANHAYELDSSDGVYLISWSIGLRSSSITTETLQEVAAFLEFSTDNFSSVLTGNVNQFATAHRLVDGASDELGSHLITGNFLYKATASGTKVRIKGFANTSGTTNYTFETVAGDMIAGAAGAQGFGSHNITNLTVVRIA